jgi:hypothetical protein
MNQHTTRTDVEKYSPEWLCVQVDRWQDRHVNALAEFLETSFLRHFLNIFIFVSALILSWTAARTFQFPQDAVAPGGYFFGARYLRHMNIILVIIAIGSCASYIQRRNLPRLQLLGFIAAIIATIVFKNPSMPESLFFLDLFLSYFFFVTFYLLFRRWKRPYLRWHHYLSVLLAGLSFRGLEYYCHFDIPYFVEVGRFFMVLSFLTVEDRFQVSEFQNLEESLSYLLSPAHLISPLPLQSCQWAYKNAWKIRLQGLWDIAISCVYLVAAYAIHNYIADKNSFSNVVENLSLGFLRYIYYFLGSYAVMNLPVGIMRWYGVALPDVFKWPLLAASPLERWQKWNTYYYNWLSKMVFFPAIRITGSLSLSVAFVFFITFLLHGGPRVLVPSSPDWSYFISLFYFFSMHGFLVYLSLRFKNWWPPSSTVHGWWGVLTMTLLMIIIHRVVMV